MVVYYTTISRLISDLKKAQLQIRLELRPALLVINEVDYMQLDRQKVDLLLRLISEHKHSSVILTSNRYFGCSAIMYRL